MGGGAAGNTRGVRTQQHMAKPELGVWSDCYSALCARGTCLAGAGVPSVDSTCPAVTSMHKSHGQAKVDQGCSGQLPLFVLMDVRTSLLCPDNVCC